MATEKQRRAPRGPQKSSIMNFRITPETKDLLKWAARASGRTASAECEHQLRRALSEMSPTPAYGILKAVRTAVETVLAIEHPQPERWTEEPELFDRVVRFLVGAMEMFRPPDRPLPPNAVLATPEYQRQKALGRGSLLELLAQTAGVDPSVLATPEYQRQIEERDKALGRASLLELLAQIARVDPSTPTARQSEQQRELVRMKEDLGELIDRPVLRELVPLAERAIKDPKGLSPEDADYIWSAIIRAIAGLRALGFFDRRLKAEGEKP
jgi:hypothetical protein